MNKYKVVIYVQDGFATVKECPPEVEVEIIDWDSLEREDLDSDDEEDNDD